MTFDRKSSYIGVKVDDACDQGVNGTLSECSPRAPNFRLSFVLDNADPKRLTPIGIDLGIVGRAPAARSFEKTKSEALGAASKDLERDHIDPTQLHPWVSRLLPTARENPLP